MSIKIRVCSKCGEEFDAHLLHNRKGFVHECGECAGKDVLRYVATMDAAAKSGSGINIFRSPSAIAIASCVIKAQNRAGYNANLGLGSTTSTFGQSHDI